MRRVRAHGGEPTHRPGPLLSAYLFQRPGQTRMTMRRRRHLADRSLARSEQTAANCTYGKSLNLEEVAHLSGESSNSLFEILSQWNQVLSAIDNPANDPKRDVCREAG